VWSVGLLRNVGEPRVGEWHGDSWSCGRTRIGDLVIVAGPGHADGYGAVHGLAAIIVYGRWRGVIHVLPVPAESPELGDADQRVATLVPKGQRVLQFIGVEVAAGTTPSNLVEGPYTRRPYLLVYALAKLVGEKAVRGDHLRGVDHQGYGGPQ
jgi:hypothetical protein